MSVVQASRDDNKHAFLENLDSFLVTNPDKPLFHCENGDFQIPTSTNCQIKWPLSNLLSQGTQAYIFDTCEDCPVVRVAEIAIKDPDLMESEETYTQFITDSKIRYFLQCAQLTATDLTEELQYCLNLKLAPLLMDVYLCHHESRYYGITALEKYEGDLMDLLLKHPAMIEWTELQNTLERLVTCLHARKVIHRDIGWQNFLYRIDEEQKLLEIVITDFESAGTQSTVKGDWERLYYAYSNADNTAVEDTIMYLQDAETFINLFEPYLNQAPPSTKGKPLKDAWQAMESLEWNKLRKFFRLSPEWVQYLEN